MNEWWSSYGNRKKGVSPVHSKGSVCVVIGDNVAFMSSGETMNNEKIL